MKRFLVIFMVLLLFVFLIPRMFKPSKPPRAPEKVVAVEPSKNENITTEFYGKADGWESPFDPYKVLDEWPLVSTQDLTEKAIIVVVGNPKIDWQKAEPRDGNAMLMPIPEGELTSAVIYLVIEIDGKPFVFIYAYMDEKGEINKYVLDLNTNKFTCKGLNNSKYTI